MSATHQDKSVQFTPNPDQSKVKHLRITVDNVRVAPSGHVRIEAISGNVGFGVRLPYMPPVPFEVGEVLFIEYPEVEGKPSFSQPFTAIYRESEKPQERNMNIATIPTNELTMTSREMAELLEKRHDKVKQSIDRLAERGVIAQPPVGDGEKAANGVVEKVYKIGKRDSYVVVAQLSPEFTARLVDRWQELEQQLAKPDPQPVIPQNLPEALRLAADLAEEKAKAEQERDEAIRTKAQISSRREASAMAKASAASRKVKRLEEQLGFCAKHATVKAVEAKTKTKIGWRKLKSWCVANNVTPIAVADQNYGEVKAWPADAWKAAYGIDLPALFTTETA